MMKGLLSYTVLFLIMVSFAIPQNTAYQSTLGHQNAITVMAPLSDTSFFSAGKDGTMILWNDEGTGAHYQFSELEIRLAAPHPNGEEFAIYETDGLAVHRVSVWNRQTLTKKYTKEFPDSISSLSYTQKGSYLTAGTTPAGQTFFLDPDTGEAMQMLREKTGIVSFIKSSDTEASCVMYSPSGLLTYYDLKTGTMKAQFATEKNLTQTTLFGNNVFFAGVRDYEIFLILATTGKTLARFPEINPVICTSLPELSGQPILYYAEITDKTAAIKKITASASAAIVPPVTVRQGTRKNWERIMGAAFCMDAVLLGSESGAIYSMPLQAGSNNAPLAQITNNNEQKIYDIAASGDFMYALTENAVYKVDVNGVTEQIAVNEDKNTRLIVYNDSLILWSENTKKPVLLINQTDNVEKVIFLPSANINSVQLDGSHLIIPDSNTTFRSFDLVTGRLTLLSGGMAPLTETKPRIQLQRAAALPIKIIKAAACMLALNSDGSVSWYEGKDARLINTWHLTENSWKNETGEIIVPLTSHSQTL